MSGTPLRPPTPDPEVKEGRRGPLELFDIIEAKRLPTAFGQGGATLCPETPPIGMGQGLRGMESYEGPNDKSQAKVKAPGMEAHKSLMWRSHIQCSAVPDSVRDCTDGTTRCPAITSERLQPPRPFDSVTSQVT